MSPLIGAAVGAASGLLQTGMGIADRIKAGKERRRAQAFFEENKYAIPESARAALGVAERQAAGVRLPAEDLRRAQMAEATAAGVGAAQQAATSGADVLGALSGLYGQQQRAEQGMAIAGAERFDRNQAMLRQELGRMADLEREKWQYNVLYPYQQMLGTAEALGTRGAMGIGAGLGAVGEAAGGYAQLQSAERGLADLQAQAGLTMGDITGARPMQRMTPIGTPQLGAYEQPQLRF
jgi:hypothetical protein